MPWVYRWALHPERELSADGWSFPGTLTVFATQRDIETSFDDRVFLLTGSSAWWPYDGDELGRACVFCCGDTRHGPPIGAFPWPVGNSAKTDYTTCSHGDSGGMGPVERRAELMRHLREGAL